MRIQKVPWNVHQRLALSQLALADGKLTTSVQALQRQMCCKWAHSTPNVWRQIFSLSKFVCEILGLEETGAFVDRWSLIVPVGILLRKGHVRDRKSRI